MHQQLSQSGLRSHIIIRSEKYQQYNCRICFSHHKSLWNTIVEQGAPATHNLWQNVNFWLVFQQLGQKSFSKFNTEFFVCQKDKKYVEQCLFSYIVLYLQDYSAHFHLDIRNMELGATIGSQTASQSRDAIRSQLYESKNTILSSCNFCQSRRTMELSFL